MEGGAESQEERYQTLTNGSMVSYLTSTRAGLGDWQVGKKKKKTHKYHTGYSTGTHCH